MATLARFVVKPDGVFFERQEQGLLQVHTIETAGKTYSVSQEAFRQAVADGKSPLCLKVQGTEIRNEGDIVVMKGEVYNHPDRDDGARIETPPITTMVLEGGERFTTKFGREGTSSPFQQLIATANGRIPSQP